MTTDEFEDPLFEDPFFKKLDESSNRYEIVKQFPEDQELWDAQGPE